MNKLCTLLLFLVFTGMRAQMDCQHPNPAALTSDYSHFNEMVRQYKQQGLHLNRDMKTIPTVVHVIYRKPQDSLDITKKRITGQIEAANRHLMRTNPDTADTRPQFKPDAAVCDIQLCLATRKPDSSTFDGILYHYDPGFWATAHLDSIRARTMLDPDRYLNVYVLPLRTGGSAIFPWWRTPDKDGFQVGSLWFGTEGNNLYDVKNQGTTFVHELGHYLGLFHPFYLSFQYEGNCDVVHSDTLGDFCADTPMDWALPLSSLLCDTGLRQCADSSYFIVQSENYMAYNRDSCTNMFSLDQRARMRACLDSVRTELTTPLNLIRTGVCSTGLSSDEHKAMQDLDFWPNPARDHIQFGELPPGKNQLYLYDLSGRIILSQGVCNGCSVSLEDVEEGIYIVSVESEKAVSLGTARLVVD